jgi:hypothetical protein
MRGIKATKLLIAPLLVAPMLVAGFAFSQAASAGPIKITCTMLSGSDANGSTITESGCTNGAGGDTNATSTNNLCETNCTTVQTWNPSGTTTTELYSAKLKTGKAAEKKCKNTEDTILATETGKITAGYGIGGKSKAEVCVNSTTNSLSLVPKSKATL